MAADLLRPQAPAISEEDARDRQVEQSSVEVSGRHCARPKIWEEEEELPAADV